MDRSELSRPHGSQVCATLGGVKYDLSLPGDALVAVRRAPLRVRLRHPRPTTMQDAKRLLSESSGVEPKYQSVALHLCGVPARVISAALERRVPLDELTTHALRLPLLEVNI